MNFISKMKAVLKKTGVSLVAALTFASVITVPSVTTTVVADSGLDVERAFIEVTGGEDIGGWNYTYNGGRNFGVIMSDGNPSAATYRSIGLDCTAGTLAVASRAIKNAGGNPRDFFGQCEGKLNNMYPAELAAYFTNMDSVRVPSNANDIGHLQPGDILVYQNAHLSIYAGNGRSIDFSIRSYGGECRHYNFMMNTGSSSTTNTLSAVYRPRLNKKISVSLIKGSSLPDCTTGNALYANLSGTFGVYTSADAAESSRVATITTDANGNGSATNISVGSNVSTVYVKELSAPTNYQLSDTSIHAVNVSSGSGSISFTDTPVNDPAAIVLSKVDSESKDNIASLEGAEFTINYYDTFDSIDGRNPVRTWVIKTTAISDGTNTIYTARLDADHLVSGTLYTKPNGEAYLPLGTITIQETKAPNNYTTDGGYLDANGNTFSADSKMTVKIVNENSMGVIQAGNVFTKKEDSIRGGLQIVKADYVTGQIAEGDASLAGAQFDLYYLGDGSGNQVSVKLDNDGDGIGDGTEYLPSETTSIAHLTVGADGTLTTSASYLGFGNYRLVETNAPVGYLVTTFDGANITKDFTVSTDGTVTTAEVPNYPIRGSFMIQKNDADLLDDYAQGSGNLQTTFQIINASANAVVVNNVTYPSGAVIDLVGDGSYTFTTDENGYYQAATKVLPYGTYTINEVTPPTGYTSDGTTTYTFSIRTDGQYEDATFQIFNSPIKGGFKIQKNDIDYDTRNQGDTDLTTTFELYNSSADAVLVDVNGDGRVDRTSERFESGEKITEFTTDKYGYYESSDKYLPYGKYTIKEKVQPTGYTKDGTTELTFDVVNNSEISDLTHEIYNRPDYGKFSIYKVTANSSSDWSTPEEDVEFTAVLSSKIGEGKAFATFEDAYAAIEAKGKSGDITDDNNNILLTVHEYSVIRTGADGTATSGDLAYGTYIIKQTSHVEDTVDVTNEATFTVREDGQATISYTATNTPMKYRVQIVKKDADTGKTVSLNSAEFKIFQLTDRKGNEVNKYVTQKVGLFTYDTFKTNSDNTGLSLVNTFSGTYVNGDEDKGTVTTPVQLEAGTYRIEEVKTPDGYLMMNEPVELRVTESTITRRDDDGDAVVVVEAVDNKPHGALYINKELEDYDYDQSLLRHEEQEITPQAANRGTDGFDYTAIKFELRAAEDIIDPADGSITTKAGELANNVYGTEVGAITLNESGSAYVENLPMGKYTLKEVAVPDGVVLDETEHEVVFTQEDTEAKHENYVVSFDDRDEVTDWEDGYKVQTAEGSIVNKVTKAEISKKAVTGDDELEGATLTVKDAATGMTVVDKNGNELTWVSGNKPRKIEGLTIDKPYILEETITADGYVKASDVTFRVNADGTVTPVTMIDKTFSVSKVDVAGEEVEGATLTVTDEDGDVVDEWISDGTKHNVNGLEEKKTYTIHETVTADGYVKATDITFTVKGEDENGNKEDEHLDVVDKVVSVSKIDMGGNEVEGAEMNVTDTEGNVIDSWISDGSEHRVVGLEEEKNYILNETVAPEGYAKATSIPFTVSGADENGVKVDQTIDMTDKKVTINKTDGNGNEVPGAKITITDEEGNVVDEWTSGDKPHDVSNLETGKKYTWHEDYGTIFGYYYAEDYTFTVTDDGIDQNLEMVDKPIKYEINKINDKGEPVKGVTLELTDVTTDDQGNYVNVDEEGNPVKVELPNGGVTTGEPFELVNKLMAGHTYALEETEIVAGVYKTGRVEFTVAKYNPATYEPVVIIMTDATTAVSVRKIDEKGKPVAGAKMQIIETTVDEEGNVVAAKDEEGNDKVVYEFTSTDDEAGTDVSDYVMGGETYILREDEAPFGFDRVEDTTFTVNGENGVYQILVVTDNHSTEYIKAVKVDSADTSKKLAGAELTLYNAKTNKKVAKGVTGEDGTVTWKVTWNDDNGGYYIKETKAPEGYKLSDEKFVVKEATEKAGLEEDAPVTVTIKNDAQPKLGVNVPFISIGLMVLGVAGLVYAITSSKKHNHAN